MKKTLHIVFLILLIFFIGACSKINSNIEIIQEETTKEFIPDLDNDLLEIYNYFNNSQDKQVNEMTGKYKNYNVISILAETLDTRFIGPVLTPNLYKLSNEGMSFSNYFTPVFSEGATCNSEFMSITSLAPITPKDWGKNMCNVYFNNVYPYSIANQLKDYGYDTYYFHSGYADFYNRKDLIPNYGFDVVKFNNAFDNNSNISFDMAYDTEMIKFMNEFVDYSTPFYINMLSYSMHGGYYTDNYKQHNDRVNEAYPYIGLNRELRVYLQKLVEFDNFIGNLLTKLRKENVLNKTLITIYPDHKIYIIDYDVYPNYFGIPSEDTEVNRQNLIIYDGNNSEGTIYDNPGSTIDIPPTLLNMLGVNADYTYFMGNDIFDKDNFILLGNNYVTDGVNKFSGKGYLVGDVSSIQMLRDIQKDKFYQMEIGKKIIEKDFFKELEKALK